MTKLRKWLTLCQEVTGRICRWKNQGRPHRQTLNVTPSWTLASQNDNLPPQPQGSLAISFTPTSMWCHSCCPPQWCVKGLWSQSFSMNNLWRSTANTALGGLEGFLVTEHYLQFIALPGLPLLDSKNKTPLPCFTSKFSVLKTTQKEVWYCGAWHGACHKKGKASACQGREHGLGITFKNFSSHPPWGLFLSYEFLSLWNDQVYFFLQDGSSL